MDKEKAMELLSGTVLDRESWEIADDKVHGIWGILSPVERGELYWVASSRTPPTLDEAELMAAAPDLARWGIGLANEVESLRAELAQARAELASFRALVVQVPQALVEALPKLVALLAKAPEEQALPPVVTP